MRVPALLLFGVSAKAEQAGPITTQPIVAVADYGSTLTPMTSADAAAGTWASFQLGEINRNPDSQLCHADQGTETFANSASTCTSITFQSDSLSNCQDLCVADSDCTFVEYHTSLRHCNLERCIPGGDECIGDDGERGTSPCCQDWTESDRPWTVYLKPAANSAKQQAIVKRSAVALAARSTMKYKQRAEAGLRRSHPQGYGWGSCEGNCGGYVWGGWCWCDIVCVYFNDCCTSFGNTYCQHCVYGGPMYNYQWWWLNHQAWCAAQGYVHGTEAPPPPPTSSPTTKYPTAYPTFNLAVQIGLDETVSHGAQPQTINYPQFFGGNDAPIIIAGIPSFNSPDFFTVRVRDVSLTGFTIVGQAASCGSNTYTNERVPWLAVAPGRHSMPDGTVIEAGTVKLGFPPGQWGQGGHNAKNVDFTADIPGAVILATTQTMNGDAGVMLRIIQKTSSGFRIRLQEDAGNDDMHVEETIGWVAISTGTGTLAGQSYQANGVQMPFIANANDFKMPTGMDNPMSPDDCTFGTIGWGGPDPAVLRTNNGMLTVQEDTCADAETAHAPEETSLLVIHGCQATRGHHHGINQVSGDPFVIDQNGQKVQFFLPLHQDVHLLTCQNMQIYGRAFGTGITTDQQQWFDKFRITMDNQEVLNVQIANNSTTLRDDADISVKNHQHKPLQILKVQVEGVTMEQTGAVSSGNALIAVWQTDAVETIQFSAGNSVMQIKSAVAQKFDEKSEQRLYTHLDIRFVELKTAECSGGILAEIWGIAAMSKETAAMLEPPAGH